MMKVPIMGPNEKTYIFLDPKPYWSEHLPISLQFWRTKGTKKNKEKKKNSYVYLGCLKKVLLAVVCRLGKLPDRTNAKLLYTRLHAWAGWNQTHHQHHFTLSSTRPYGKNVKANPVVIPRRSYESDQ